MRNKQLKNLIISKGRSAKEGYKHEQLLANLDEIYQKYIKGKNYISPTTLSKDLDCSINESFTILEKLVKNNFLKRIYKFQCPDLGCSKLYRNFTYINLPNVTICNCNNKEYRTREYLYVIYKVL